MRYIHANDFRLFLCSQASKQMLDAIALRLETVPERCTSVSGLQMHNYRTSRRRPLTQYATKTTASLFNFLTIKRAYARQATSKWQSRRSAEMRQWLPADCAKASGQEGGDRQACAGPVPDDVQMGTMVLLPERAWNLLALQWFSRCKKQSPPRLATSAPPHPGENPGRFCHVHDPDDRCAPLVNLKLAMMHDA